jgi:hypothetical protein
MRALAHSVCGGADFGECFTTAARLTDGDTESWYREWRETADRLCNEAEQSAAGGHAVSTRKAYLRAYYYY